MRADAALISALEGSNIHPLWDRYQRITPLAPRPKDAPMHWRWRDIEPLAERAAKEVAIEDVERRALIRAHPAFAGATAGLQDEVGRRYLPRATLPPGQPWRPPRPGRR